MASYLEPSLMVPKGVQLSGGARSIQKSREEHENRVLQAHLRKDKFYQMLAANRLYTMVADQGQMRQMRKFLPGLQEHLSRCMDPVNEHRGPERGETIRLEAEEDERLCQGPGPDATEEEQ